MLTCQECVCTVPSSPHSHYYSPCLIGSSMGSASSMHRWVSKRAKTKVLYLLFKKIKSSICYFLQNICVIQSWKICSFKNFHLRFSCVSGLWLYDYDTKSELTILYDYGMIILDMIYSFFGQNKKHDDCRQKIFFGHLLCNLKWIFFLNTFMQLMCCFNGNFTLFPGCNHLEDPTVTCYSWISLPWQSYRQLLFQLDHNFLLK